MKSQKEKEIEDAEAQLSKVEKSLVGLPEKQSELR